MRLDGAFVNAAHDSWILDGPGLSRDRPRRFVLKLIPKLIDERGPVVAGGRFRDVERSDDGAIRVGL